MASDKQPDLDLTSVQVRERLVEALRLDLVGPWAGHELAEEKLPGWVRPSSWYLTGFLVPTTAPMEQRSSDEGDEDGDADVSERTGLGEESQEDGKAAKKSFFPSSIGLSFLLPKDAKGLSVTLRWGDYVMDQVEGKDGKPLNVWQRQARERLIEAKLRTGGKPQVVAVPDSGGLELHLVSQSIAAAGLEEHLPLGCRSVSVFLVNHRPPTTEGAGDPAFAFQPELEVRCGDGFLPRPDLRGSDAQDWDEQVADLHYADTPEYASGHGVSADWEIVDGTCRLVRTCWIPGAEVEATKTEKIAGVTLSMSQLGSLADGAAIQRALTPLVDAYQAWIKERIEETEDMAGTRKETAGELLRLAGIAAQRISRGIQVLVEDADALDAFRMANRAVGSALYKRLKIEGREIEDPQWRAFQLAFILLNLPGLVDPKDPERETVDLLFFPTGGGKTEAYLGLAAFSMVLRRLCHPGDQGLAGAGVSVIMRYTLRLLTLDQLARAAGLVCALELERQQAEARYGIWPFEIGLWVGKAATPNRMGHKGDKRQDTARTKVRQYKNDPKGKPSPIPLEDCPWCGTRFTADSFSLQPNEDHPRELRIHCADFECEFSGEQALPVVAVDDELYRKLPAFLIATVDKFASLPWVGECGALLGGADRHDSSGFYGAAESGVGHRLTEALPPPDLIIQDELHLISGPLGTMAGLYETMIEALCLHKIGDHEVRPKIVASTATVRRAQDQIQALFARPITQIFPPPGPDRRDSFFARTLPASEVSARKYLGIAAQGRNPKQIMRHVVLALMSAAEKSYRDAGGHHNEQNPADPYMTMLAYFNSLRELGGARRILEEQVHHALRSYGARRRINQEHALFRDRRTSTNVWELTSRVPTDKVADTRRRLECQFHEDQRVDYAIATNMISVGLDISRLGLMVVTGQCKSSAEYIQATSRVGRDDQRPGLVVTLLNIHKPRDRSHYERFHHYHETFYRSVEASSVTPFSARALDRGLAGALVGLARHLRRSLTPPKGAEELSELNVELEQRLRELFIARIDHQPITDEQDREQRKRNTQDRIADLLDSWRKVVEDYHQAGVQVQYQQYELDGPKPLLRGMLEDVTEGEHHHKFRANRSLRDVEPEVNLFLKELHGSSREDGS